MKKEKRQKMCLEIIDQFEQLLEEKDISIPCEDSAEEKERRIRDFLIYVLRL